MASVILVELRFVFSSCSHVDYGRRPDWPCRSRSFTHKDQDIRRSHHEEEVCQPRSAVRRLMTGSQTKTKIPLAAPLATCDYGIHLVALRPLVDIRFYLDPDTGLPHIYGHGVTEGEVEQVLRASGGDVRGSRGSRMK